MAKTPRILKVERILFGAGEMRPRELPKTVYRGLSLVFSITHTNGVGPVITADSFYNVVQRIAVVVDGQDRLIDISGRDLYYMNQYDQSLAPFTSFFTTNSVQGTSKGQLYLPFILTRSLNPEDTLLDARKVSNLTLEITWGTSIGTTVTSLDSGFCRIQTDEYANAAEVLEIGRHEMSVASRNLDATGSVTLNMDVGSNNQYRRLWIFTRDNSSVLSDAQIDNIVLRSRSFNYLDTDDEQLQERNRQEYSITHQTGLYVIDFTRDGKMTQRVDARQLSELVIDVNSLVSNGSIRVIKEKAIFA